MGIEPTRPAWKAGVLPLNYTRIYHKYSMVANLKLQPFWCGRRDLNSYACWHQNLNLARLPIPPRPHENRIGDPSETRTPDTLIKSQVLYRLS